MTMKYVTFCKSSLTKPFWRNISRLQRRKRCRTQVCPLKTKLLSPPLLLLALLMLFHTQVWVSSRKSHCLQHCLGEGGRLSLWLQQVENTKKIKDGWRYCVFFFFFKSNTALLPCVVYTVQHASTGTTRTAWEEWESAALGALEANSWSRTSGTGFSLFLSFGKRKFNITHLQRDFGVYRCIGTRKYDNYLGRPSYGSSYGRGYDRTESVYMEVLWIKLLLGFIFVNVFLISRSSSTRRDVAIQEVSMEETIIIPGMITGVGLVDTGAPPNVILNPQLFSLSVFQSRCTVDLWRQDCCKERRKRSLEGEGRKKLILMIRWRVL